MPVPPAALAYSSQVDGGRLCVLHPLADAGTRVACTARPEDPRHFWDPSIGIAPDNRPASEIAKSKLASANCGRSAEACTSGKRRSSLVLKHPRRSELADRERRIVHTRVSVAGSFEPFPHRQRAAGSMAGMKYGTAREGVDRHGNRNREVVQLPEGLRLHLPGERPRCVRAPKWR